MVQKTGTLDGMQNSQMSESSEQTATFLIRSRFHTLSRSNQKIATYILEHADSLSSMTITQVSQKTGVSPSGVTRFCQAFGFSGFSEFKYYVSTNLKFFQLEDKHICPNESFGSVKSKIRRPPRSASPASITPRSCVMQTFLFATTARLMMTCGL